MDNYRETELYKKLDSYTACAIAEGFSGVEESEQDILTAWQYLIDKGLCWRLQGWYGRTAQNLIESGLLQSANSVESGL